MFSNCKCIDFPIFIANNTHTTIFFFFLPTSNTVPYVNWKYCFIYIYSYVWCMLQLICCRRHHRHCCCSLTCSHCLFLMQNSTLDICISSTEMSEKITSDTRLSISICVHTQNMCHEAEWNRRKKKPHWYWWADLPEFFFSSSQEHAQYMYT